VFTLPVQQREVRSEVKTGCFQTNFPRGLSVAEVRSVNLSSLRISLSLARLTGRVSHNVWP